MTNFGHKTILFVQRQSYLRKHIWKQKNMIHNLNSSSLDLTLVIMLLMWGIDRQISNNSIWKHWSIQIKIIDLIASHCPSITAPHLKNVAMRVQQMRSFSGTQTMVSYSCHLLFYELLGWHVYCSEIPTSIYWSQNTQCLITIRCKRKSKCVLTIYTHCLQCYFNVTAIN